MTNTSSLKMNDNVQWMTVMIFYSIPPTIYLQYRNFMSGQWHALGFGQDIDLISHKLLRKTYVLLCVLVVEM